MDIPPFYANLNKEARELKRYLNASESVEDFVDGTISYIADHRELFTEKNHFLKSQAHKDAVEERWYQYYDEYLQYDNGNSDGNILVEPKAVKNYDYEINLTYSGTGFRLYESVLAHKIGLESFMMLNNKEKKQACKTVEQQIALKSVTTESFKTDSLVNFDDFGQVELNFMEHIETSSDSSESSSSKSTKPNPSGFDNPNPFQAYCNFQDNAFPQLVAVDHKNAVMTCLEAWLDMNLAEGLIMLNEFLLSKDQDDFLA